MTAPPSSSLPARLLPFLGKLPRALPIGFYLGRRGLGVAQAERLGNNSLRWRALYGSVYPQPLEELLAAPREFRRFARATLRAAGCRGSAVVSALPVAKLRIVSTTYSINSGQSPDSALLHHLKDRLREDLAQCVIDWLPIRDAQEKAGDSRSALVAVARRADVVDYLDLLTGAGLEPHALDIGPAALARLVRVAAPADKQPNVLILNFGVDVSFLTVLWGRRLMLDRSISFGEGALIDTIAGAFDIPAAEAAELLHRHGVDGKDEMGAALAEILRSTFMDLVREISRVLVYFASQTHGGSVGEIRVLGVLAECPGVADFLARQLEAPVGFLDPFATLPLAKLRGGELDRTGLAVAAGLALRERH